MCGPRRRRGPRSSYVSVNNWGRFSSFAGFFFILIQWSPEYTGEMQFSFGKRRIRSKMSRRWSAWEGGTPRVCVDQTGLALGFCISWRDGVSLRSWGCSWYGDLTSQVSSSEGTQQGWALFRVTVTCVSPFKARFIYFCSMCMGVLPSYVSVYHVPCTFTTVVRCHETVGIWTRVFCKSRQCSSLLNEPSCLVSVLVP